MKTNNFFSVATDGMIHNVCKYVVKQKQERTSIEELLQGIIIPKGKTIENIPYKKPYAYYLWNKINDYLSSQHAGNCLSKSMAMYRLSSIFGWKATIFVCLPKDTSSMQNGHAYICVEDHFWGIDPSTEYNVVFRFEKDEIQWTH